MSLLQPQIVGDLTEEREKPEQLMFDLEGLIQNHVKGVDELKIEVKKHKEQLSDILAANETLQELTKVSNDATKEKNKQKAEVMKNAHAKELAQTIKELQGEIKEKTNALGEYAVEYQRVSGLHDIEGANGELYEIQLNAKLVKR